MVRATSCLGVKGQATVHYNVVNTLISRNLIEKNKLEMKYYIESRNGSYLKAIRS